MYVPDLSDCNISDVDPADFSILDLASYTRKAGPPFCPSIDNNLSANLGASVGEDQTYGNHMHYVLKMPG